MQDELDTILILIMFGADGILKPDGSSLIAQIIYAQESQLNKAKQAILAWHSKQVAKAELKDRLESLELIHNMLCQIADGEQTVETWIKWNQKDIKNIKIRIKELESKINE